jgi:glycosyltransferase involved in cell wall biosynthesis
MEKISVSIVIPCYNEFLNLKHLVEECKETAKDNPNYNIEFIFVDNGSTDNSSIFLREITHPNIRVFNIQENIGYGNGIIQGLKRCSNETVAWTHSDLQTDVRDIVNGLKYINNGQSLIKGKRVSRKLLAKSLSLGMSIYTYFKLGFWINEINAQPKIFKKEFLNEIINMAPLDFSLDLYFCIEAKKREGIKEFNVYFKKRKHEEAKGGGGSLKQKIRIIKRTISYINKLSTK